MQTEGEESKAGEFNASTGWFGFTNVKITEKAALPRPSGLWFLPPGDHMGLRLQDWAALLEEDEDVSPRLL